MHGFDLETTLESAGAPFAPLAAEKGLPRYWTSRREACGHGAATAAGSAR